MFPHSSAADCFPEFLQIQIFLGTAPFCQIAFSASNTVKQISRAQTTYLTSHDLPRAAADVLELRRAGTDLRLRPRRQATQGNLNSLHIGRGTGTFEL